MGRQLESYDIVFIFHPKTMVHLWEISYQLYPFQNKGETTGVMMSFFIFKPKTMVHLLEMSYQLYPFFNNGEITGVMI